LSLKLGSGSLITNCLSCTGAKYFNNVAKTCVNDCPIGNYGINNICSNVIYSII
jgi:hypothetical protein